MQKNVNTEIVENFNKTVEAQRKNKERQEKEEVTVEPKGFMIQETARGFLCLRKHC